MGRYTGPKNKLSRREGYDVFSKSSPRLDQKLKQVPGEAGTKRRSRLSAYGLQLREKQKVKRIYGLREKQFRKVYALAEKQTELTTGEALLQLLEQRLDNVVFRLGMARSRPQARQFVVHGKVLVDGQPVKSPSYRIQKGQSVTLIDEFFTSGYIQAILKDAHSLPEWLEVKNKAGHVTKLPSRDQVEQGINEELIIAFYSR